MGNTVDYDHYSKLAGNIRNAINTKFFDATTGKYASGSQTEQSVPLYWDVVPEEYRSLAADYLAEVVRDNDFKLDVGVLGATTLMHALSENGHAEAALRIALQKEFPSWGYWIMNGATTLHENWDPLASRDNSYNHMMFGAVGGWLFSGLAGIEMDTEAPGFAKFKLQPKINTSIDDIDVQFDSVHGPIRSSWKKEQKKDEMTYQFSVPKNTSATLDLGDMRADIIRLNNKPVKNLPNVFTPGDYTVTYEKNVSYGQ